MGKLTTTNGHMNINIGGELLSRYEIMKNIGEGSYGRVFRILDHKYKKKMAVKIIKHKYLDIGIQEKDVLINIYDWYEEENLSYETDFIPLILYKEFTINKHMCMVFQLYMTDLYDYSVNNTLEYNDIVLISRDLFKAIGFLRRHKFVHADLKPENIMLTKYMRAVIIDYGLSFFEKSAKTPMYIQSRYYRAPEIYFNIPIKCAIDTWSVGCIMYEMYYNKALFRGKNETEMIVSYISCLGMPFSEYIEMVLKKTKFKIDLYEYQHKSIPTNKYIYNNKLIDDDKNININSLIRRCLTYNWPTRIMPDTALQHEFFT